MAALNLGGGFYPDEANNLFEWLKENPIIPETALKHRPRLILEPGRAIAQPAGYVLSRVLDVRGDKHGRDVVIDASIAEISEASHFPHRVATMSDGPMTRILGDGRDRLLGRTCMEMDVIATDIDLSTVKRGQMLAVLDAGGYDSSMEYKFGYA
jgi:diaminopimelate decarboxylase